MRYFLHIGYDGSNYKGWQKQKNTQNTVQEVIEKKVSQIFKKEMTIYGCGRTDSGVHASQYIMQINVDQAPDFDLKYRLNKNLPDNIAVFEIREVDDNHNCRYHAIARTYDYFVHWNKDPVLMRYSAFYEGIQLDYDLMNKATDLIRNTRDFRPVCKRPDVYDNTLCNVSECRIFVNEQEGRLRFTITSNRFLRGMVRLCVFFLLKVGTGALSLSDFEKILTQEIQSEEKQPAFPNGLFLSKVQYPFITFQDSHQLIKMLKLGLEE